MIFPDKIVTVQNSIIAKSIYIIRILQKKELKVSILFDETKDYFEDISEFLLALDTLYLLDKIEIMDESKVIRYVEKNNM